MAEPETGGPEIEEPGMSVSVCRGGSQILRRSESNKGVKRRSGDSSNEGVGLGAKVTDFETGTERKLGIRGSNIGVPDVTSSINEVRGIVPTGPAGAVTEEQGTTDAALETA